jgi:hypothetical protein
MSALGRLPIPAGGFDVITGVIVGQVIEVAEIAHRVGVPLGGRQLPAMEGLREILRTALAACMEDAEPSLGDRVAGRGLGLDGAVIHLGVVIHGKAQSR